MSGWVSTNEMDAEREARKKALAKEVERAKQEFAAKQRKKELKERSGEDKWMNPALTKRLAYKDERDDRPRSSSSSKKHKKSKKSKKPKSKSKSSKKKKSRSKSKKVKKDKKDDSSSSSDSNGDDDDDDDDGDEWEERDEERTSIINEANQQKTTNNGQRQEWMSRNMGMSDSRKAVLEKRKKEEEEKEAKEYVDMHDMTGQSTRELNPYWKNGGTGLPEGGEKKLEDRVNKKVAESQFKKNEDTSDTAPAPKILSWRERVKQRVQKANESNTVGKDKSHKAGIGMGTPGLAMAKPSAETVLNVWSTTKMTDKNNQNKEKELEKSANNDKDNNNNESNSSSSSDNDDDDVIQPPSPIPEINLNKLNAKIMKAELMGDDEEADEVRKQISDHQIRQTEYDLRLKNWKEDMAKRQEEHKEKQNKKRQHIEKDEEQDRKKRTKLQLDEEKDDDVDKDKGKDNDDDTTTNSEHDVIFSAPDRMGISRPLMQKPNTDEFTSRGKLKKTETHSGTNREAYYNDDNKLNLNDLVRKERLGDDHDYDGELLKNYENITDNYDSDVFIPKEKSSEKSAEIERKKATAAYNKQEGIVAKCKFCVDGPEFAKHTVVAIGIDTFLSVPENQSLVTGHCLIVPMQHVAALRELDESALQELKIFKKYLTKMFFSRNCTPLFMETAMNFKWQRHAVVEVIPLPNDETGSMASIYFKKALADMGSEWAQHKKIVDTNDNGGNNIRGAIPSGFPYFHVEFGTQGGFARVIDDEEKFPNYFGKEIAGGMLDLEPRLWRKPPIETFDVIKRKLLNFSNIWQAYDWTKTLEDGQY